MMNSVQEYISLNEALEKYDEGSLNDLYTAVFNTEKGQLVLMDIANRSGVYVPIEGITKEEAEGIRKGFLSIQTRLQNSILSRKEGQK